MSNAHALDRPQNGSDFQLPNAGKDSQLSSVSQLASADSSGNNKASDNGALDMTHGQLSMQAMFSTNSLAADLGITATPNTSGGGDQTGNSLATLGNEFKQLGAEFSTVGMDLSQISQDFNSLTSDLKALFNAAGMGGNSPASGNDNSGASSGCAAGSDSGCSGSHNAGSDTPGSTQPNAGSDTPGSTQPNAGSDTPGSTQPNAGSDTPGSTQPNAGSDTPGSTQPNAGSDTGGGVITGVAQGGGQVTDLPNTTDLQTLANAMTANAMNSGEWQAGDYPITLAPGDATIANGGSVTDAQGNVFTLQQMPNWPAGQVMENGQPVPGGDYTDALRIVNGQLFAESAKGNGWWNLDGGGWNLVGPDPGTSGGGSVVAGSDAGAQSGTAPIGSDGTSGAAPIGSDGTIAAPPTVPGTLSDGSLVTGSAQGGGSVQDLPQGTDLQTLANAMQANAMNSGEFDKPDHGTPITLAPGDITPVSGGSIDAGGHQYSLAPTGNWPSGTLLEDGSPVQWGTYSAALRVVNGTLWIEDAKTMGWRSYDGNGGWSSFQGDPGVSA